MRGVDGTGGDGPSLDVPEEVVAEPPVGVGALHEPQDDTTGGLMLQEGGLTVRAEADHRSTCLRK
eukprot:490549-Prorocentrum_minimum.AAC.1